MPGGDDCVEEEVVTAKTVSKILDYCVTLKYDYDSGRDGQVGQERRAK